MFLEYIGFEMETILQAGNTDDHRHVSALEFPALH